jgi:ACR3 family arsenite efflux pump ArsB
LVTLFVNWLVKPFGMAFLGWFFIQWLFSSVLGWIDPITAKNYVAGLIILAAAPCTAMVFVWSYLTWVLVVLLVRRRSCSSTVAGYGSSTLISVTI